MQKNPLYNTSSISFFQYLFAIAVILVHSGRLTSYEPLHFGLKSMLGRLAVPFFIVCASFFLKQSLGNSQKMKAYLVKIVKTYLFWSFVYLPYAWLFFSSLHLPVYLFMQTVGRHFLFLQGGGRGHFQQFFLIFGCNAVGGGNAVGGRNSLMRHWFVRCRSQTVGLHLYSLPQGMEGVCLQPVYPFGSGARAALTIHSNPCHL